jgi:FAD/FMN-containing dehydrogenase
MTHLLNTLTDTFSDDLVSLADAQYLTEPRKRFVAKPMPLLRPRSTQQVSDIVTYCATRKIGIVPFGGGTGLVGGQVSPSLSDTIIVSLERMNQVRAVSPLENAITVEAGIILADVQTAADDVDRLFPLSLASQGSCRIGGNLATNAGGVQVLHYGNTRDLCLGIEAVLPDGQIFHGLKTLRKDNTGYDLRHLLIGSEGSLGIITAACLKLFPKPAQKATAMIAVPNPEAAIELLAFLRARLQGVMTAFELIHDQSYNFLLETMPQIRQPFVQTPKWSILMELSGGVSSDLDANVTEFLSLAVEADLITDAVIAQSQSQADAFWTVRESIPEANRLIGSISSHDISIPISLIPKFINETPALLARIGDFRINCFGHLGDGNLHYNVFPPQGVTRDSLKKFSEEIQKIVHDQTHAFGGSVSAEHGIGRLKRDDLETYGDPAKLSAMRAIKAALDPNGIMNPGAVLAQN